MSERYYEALDEFVSDDAGPPEVALCGGFLAIVGALVALVGVIPW